MSMSAKYKAVKLTRDIAIAWPALGFPSALVFWILGNFLLFSMFFLSMSFTEKKNIEE